MTTEAAQRRVLEALAHLQRAGLPLAGEDDSLTRMAREMRAMKTVPLIAAFPHVVAWYDALADLFEAVRDDLATERTD